MRFLSYVLVLVIVFGVSFGMSGCSLGNQETTSSDSSTEVQSRGDSDENVSTGIDLPRVADEFEELDSTVDESSLDIINNW